MGAGPLRTNFEISSHENHFPEFRRLGNQFLRLPELNIEILMKVKCNAAWALYKWNCLVFVKSSTHCGICWNMWKYCCGILKLHDINHKIPNISPPNLIQSLKSFWQISPYKLKGPLNRGFIFGMLRYVTLAYHCKLQCLPQFFKQKFIGLEWSKYL